MIWAACLLLIAAGLTVLEVLIPSFGLLALGAMTTFGFAVVTAFRANAVAGWTILGLGVVLVPCAWRLGLHLMPHTPFGKRMMPPLPTRPAPVAAAVPLGAEGIALTDLRPSGAASFGGQRIDVISRGPWLPKGTPVLVLDVEGARVVVVDAQSVS